MDGKEMTLDGRLVNMDLGYWNRNGFMNFWTSSNLHLSILICLSLTYI